ncbi:MAG: cereblon family protein [Desulfopila sp.]
MLRCRNCGSGVTSEDERLAVAGAHRHTFFNPVGIVYELGCFASALGCSLDGELTDEFSWFSGYMWRIALCRRCLFHLGWHFQSPSHMFYGLILSRLYCDGP